MGLRKKLNSFDMFWISTRIQTRTCYKRSIYFHHQDTDMQTILGGVKVTYLFDLMLETKTDEEEFPVYKPGGRMHIVFATRVLQAG